MELKKLQELGSVVFSQSLHPICKDFKLLNTIIIGFDTEYDSLTKKLISIQLSYEGVAKLFPMDSITWTELFAIVQGFLRDRGVKLSKRITAIKLISYFSIAEAQFLDTLAPEVRVDQWGSGNYDFHYPTRITVYMQCPLCGAKQKDSAGSCECGYQGRFKRKEQVRQYLQIIDLQTWFRGMPLAKVAETFGLRKLEYDRTRISKECLTDPKFHEYACHDAVLCEKIYKKLRKTFWLDFGVDIARTKTPANTSMTIFRKRFLSRDCEQRDTILRRLVLLASWGGNNQCFARGVFRGRYTEYDAKSMYPNSAICLRLLPTDDDWYACASLESFLNPLNIGGVCEVLFEFPRNCMYPCLPVMIEGALAYPLAGRSYCTLEEVRLAHKMGAKLVLIRGYAYRTGLPDLAGYLQELMFRKDEAEEKGDTVRRTLYKLMANSIIGKFTQKVVEYDINEIKRFAAKYDIPVKDLMRMKNLEAVGISKKVNLGSGFYPEWNTLILGYARSVLAEAFWQNAHRVMAGTTDSLILEGDMKQTEIRGIKFEKKAEGDFLALVRTRFYLLATGDEVKHIAYHGMRSREEALKVLMNGIFEESHTYLAKHLRKYREALRHGQALGDEITQQFRIWLGWDGKRRLYKLPDGNFYSVPLETCELEREYVE